MLNEILKCPNHLVQYSPQVTYKNIIVFQVSGNMWFLSAYNCNAYCLHLSQKKKRTCEK